MTCHRFPLLRRPRARRLLGAGGVVGPVRLFVIGCVGAIGGGVLLAKPPPLPLHRADPPAIVAPAEPVAIPAPGGVLVLGLGVVALAAVRRWRASS